MWINGMECGYGSTDSDRENDICSCLKLAVCLEWIEQEKGGGDFGQIVESSEPYTYVKAIVEKVALYMLMLVDSCWSLEYFSKSIIIIAKMGLMDDAHRRGILRD